MYEKLTSFIPALEESDYGVWAPQYRDGSTENPYTVPFVLYERCVRRLEEEVYDFADDHLREKAGDYLHILEESNITWGMQSMKKADASALDGRTVFALLTGAFRAERCRPGALLEFCESGCILQWLRRLKEIDGEDILAIAG